MRKLIRLELVLFTLITFTYVIASCEERTSKKNKEASLIAAVENPPTQNTPKKLTEAFKKYWYAGNAEITSYKLEQARYGELRDGHAVLIYVTEPFLAEKQVKADRDHPENIPVLKLNSTKKFLTGIYPYSIMSSTFYPVYDDQHAIKVSLSVQEWCGHVYTQLNNRDQFEVLSHSYFEGEADQRLTLEKNILENELWTRIRIDPAGLPVGDINILPSLEYNRIAHKEIKAYKATATLTNEGSTSSYSIHYPELERTLTIHFTNAFPYTIEGWSESFKSGFGAEAKVLTSTATKVKALKTPYWQQNGNKDVFLRDSLGI